VRDCKLKEWGSSKTAYKKTEVNDAISSRANVRLQKLHSVILCVVFLAVISRRRAVL
jgi:hypothetical protein